MQNKANERGLFLPTESHINFAVLDVKSLTKSSDNIPTITECGIIEKSLELLDRHKEYVLLIDGKKIAIGLGKGLGHLLVENSMFTYVQFKRKQALLRTQCHN